MQPEILMIHTGGTLSMKSLPDGTLCSSEVSTGIDQHVPELSKIATIRHKQLFAIDSSQLEIHHITEIATVLYENRSLYDGFVITHGTDTMTYTASALSFMFRNFGKPIVLTGAQRPLDEARTDAKSNLIDAVTIASIEGLNEIMIVFNATVFRGSRATKIKIDQYDAFHSYNFPPLAKMGLKISFHKEIRFKSKGNYRYFPKLNGNIIAFKLFPGLSFGQLKFLKEPDAIIIDAYGSGNLQADEEFRSYLKSHPDIPMIIHSQAPMGHVNLDIYQMGRILKSLGAIGSGNITFEALIFKTMHLLAYSKTKRSFIRGIITNQVGEMD